MGRASEWAGGDSRSVNNYDFAYAYTYNYDYDPYDDYYCSARNLGEGGGKLRE